MSGEIAWRLALASIDSAGPGDCALALQPGRQRATNRTVFRMTTHFTATVMLAWLVTTPIVIETGTAPPGVTDSGISAFSCTRPAVASDRKSTRLNSSH